MVCSSLGEDEWDERRAGDLGLGGRLGEEIEKIGWTENFPEQAARSGTLP